MSEGVQAPRVTLRYLCRTDGCRAATGAARPDCPTCRGSGYVLREAKP